MAYASQTGDKSSNTWLWATGGVGLVYLWYRGYLAEWFPSLFGTTVTASTSTTSAASGATTQSVNQVAGTSSVAQATDPTPLANESYYTWLASGQPLSVLEDINAAAALEESNYIKAHSGDTSLATSVVSASPTSTLTPSVSVPATQSVINAVGGSDYATAGPVALGLATLANGILTYKSGISYQVGSDGSMTMLTKSTNAQAYDNAQSVPVASTSMVARTPTATPPIINTGRITTQPVRTVASPTSVSSANPNPATRVTPSTSFNPFSGK